MTTQTTPVLLKNGTLLTHSSDEPPRVIPLLQHDVLLENGLITQIGKDLKAADESTQVVDCTDKIVSPGFVNTHLHAWQSLLKGRLSDATLLSYFAKGHMVSYVYTPEDLYLSQLAGCLEALDGGNTTVLEHAHGCHTPDHVEKALNATADSGIRSIWAYAEPYRLEKWDEKECVPSYDYWNENTIACVESMAKRYNSGESRVEVGIGFDLWFMPREMTTPLFERLAKAGVKTFTSHVGRDLVQGLGSPISNIEQKHEIFNKEKAFFGFENFVAAHCMGIKDDQLEAIKEIRDGGLNLSISSTPTTEAAMCMHQTPAFHPTFSAIPHHSTCSIGVDCLSSGITYMPAIGTQLMNMARINSNEKYLAEDKYPLKMRGTHSEVFNMMTVYGARALGMDKAGGIGKLEVGRKADLVVIDTERPGIGAAARHNPLDAVIAFSNSGDVEHVFVAGLPIKQDFKLSPFNYRGAKADWKTLRKELLASYEAIEERIKKLNLSKGTELITNLLHIDTSRLVQGDV